MHGGGKYRAPVGSSCDLNQDRRVEKREISQVVLDVVGLRIEQASKREKITCWKVSACGRKNEWLILLKIYDLLTKRRVTTLGVGTEENVQKNDTNNIQKSALRNVDEIDK